MRVCPVLLVFSVLVFSASLTLGKEDPELRQCKHQCRQQRQFGDRQKLHCERSCEEYIKQKERVRREREMGGGEIGRMEEEIMDEVFELGRGDPELQYKKCREKCQDEKEERREQQVCESECERVRRQQEREWKGRDEFERERGFEREEEEEEESQGKGERGHPYVFHDQQFTTQFETQEGRVRVLPKFTKRSKLFKGIENYRVLLFEANPQTFIVPNHWDADAIFFVAQGKGTVNLVFTDRRETFNIEQGHVMVIPAGVSVYLINKGNHEKLVLVKLINPVSNPGKFKPFFEAGGQNPESFFNAFSTEVLEAVFKTSSDRIQRIFSQQREGPIIRASKEQIRAMSHEQTTIWPFGSKTSKDFSPIQLLRQRPKESNEYGTLFEINPNDNNILQDLGIAVSFANITEGSMHTPFYNSRATKIAVVVNGRGHFEMACPHVSQSGQQHQHQHHHHQGRTRRSEEETTTPVQYQKISSELRRGTVFVVPAGHPFVTIASQDQNLEVVCFEVNALNNRKFPLGGQKNIMKNFEREAKELAFATSAEEVDRVFESQEEEFFFRGPTRSQGPGVAAELVHGSTE